MNTGTWLTVTQARQVLGKSERTIRRWVSDGKLQSRQGDSGVEVLVEGTGTDTGVEDVTPQVMPVDLQAEAQRLKAELDRRDRQIEELQNDKRHLQERAERLEQLLAMEKNQNQRLIDYQLQPFWKKWFGKQKSLPAPGDMMDMEPDTAKES